MRGLQSVSSGRSSKRKGKAGELEVVKLARKHGFLSRRTPFSGAGHVKGDVTEFVPGYHAEVKRCETLSLPLWLRQSYADAGVDTPTVIFRCNDRRDGDPVGRWHITVPLEDWLSDQAELRELRAA